MQCGPPQQKLQPKDTSLGEGGLCDPALWAHRQDSGLCPLACLLARPWAVLGLGRTSQLRLRLTWGAPPPNHEATVSGAWLVHFCQAP